MQPRRSRAEAENFPARAGSWHPVGVRVLFAALAFLFPLLAALGQSISEPLFRTDTATRAVLSGEALLQQVPSLRAAELFLVLPFGSHAARAGLVGTLSLGLAGWFLYELTLASATRQGGSSKLDPWLALTACLTSVVGASWLVEGALLGGAAPAASLALGWLVLAERRDTRARETGRNADSGLDASIDGLVLGTLAAESLWCALGLLVARSFVRSDQLRLGLWTFGCAGATAAVWLLPALAHAGAPATWTLELGDAFPWSTATWLRDVGVIVGVAALGGVITSVMAGVPGSLRLALVLLFDLLAPAIVTAEVLPLEAHSSRAALHLFAIGLWSTFGMLGLRAFAESAPAFRLPGARALGTLTVVLALGASLAGAEAAVREVDWIPRRAVREFTDGTLGRLPPRAVVLLHSRALADRLRTAQMASERPDVLLVPLDLLGDVRWMKRLLTEEPRLDQLVRDLNVQGTPSEHALSLLSDVRPVYAEADPSWDRRLLEHLVPLPLLARFSPHALGRSDRLAAWQKSSADLVALQATMKSGEQPDTATEGVVRFGLEHLVAALDKAGDKKMAALVQSSFAPEAEVVPANPTAPQASSALAARSH